MVDLTAAVFGAGPVAPADYRAQVEAVVEPERTFVVDDGDLLVGTGGAFSYELALPGGAVPLAAVTEVGVAPTHRRRGILRSLMDALVDQAIERGEPLAGLTASEGAIYRRFGYGVATRFQSVTVDRARSAEVVTPAATGRVRLVTEIEAATVVPGVWDRHWRRTPGELSRNAGWWRAETLDPESERDGASARYVVVHDGADGVADGFAVYRVKQDWSPGSAGHELRVVELAAADDAVEAALLRYLLDVDLVATVRWPAAPVDLPLRWRLVDPRAVGVTASATTCGSGRWTSPGASPPAATRARAAW